MKQNFLELDESKFGGTSQIVSGQQTSNLISFR